EPPDLPGRGARNLVERRCAEAMRVAGDAPAVTERIARPPRTCLLAQEAADIARQAALLEPLPSQGRARVATAQLVEEGTASGREWRVEVASRDRPGLLATVSAVLSDSGLSVQEAGVAPWGDRRALDAFRLL